MPGISPILGLPMANQDSDFVTDFPDAVDIPRTTGLEKFTVPRFANITERDSKIPAPVDGQLCYLKDTGTLQQHNGFVWIGNTSLQTPTGQNGWTMSNCRYRMDSTGLVTFMGAAQRGAGTGTGALCTLPATYGPDATSSLMFPALTWNGSTRGGANVMVATNGALTLQDFMPGSPTSVVEIGLNFTYRANFKAVR